MQYRNLGRAGVKVSTLCLGGMTFGEADEKSMMHKIGSDEGTSFAVLDRAREVGINFIDVADVYGQDGLSERVLGRWMKERGARDDVVLATKFRFRMRPGPNGTGASRRHILRAVEESLQRLQTDRIDLYQVHMQDIETPEEETLRALDDLVRQGKVHYIGASNYAAYRLTESHWISKTQNLERFVTLQAEYSLMVRTLEREGIPACTHLGIGLLPWSPLAGGFLTAKHTGAPSPGSRMEKWVERWTAYANERGTRVLEALRAVAKEAEAAPAAVALAWLLHKPVVTSVIFGARTVAQLDDNVKAAELKLTPAQVTRLDEASAFDLGYPYDFMQRVQKRW